MIYHNLCLLFSWAKLRSSEVSARSGATNPDANVPVGFAKSVPCGDPVP
jgi:hypothetical protein